MAAAIAVVVGMRVAGRGSSGSGGAEDRARGPENQIAHSGRGPVD